MAVLDRLQQLLGGGDPEAAGAAQASTAMQPMTQPWLDKVLSGEMARQGLDYYNQNPMEAALGFTGGGLGTRAGGGFSLGKSLGDVYPGSNAQRYPITQGGEHAGEVHIIPMSEGKSAYIDNVEMAGGWQQTPEGGRVGAGQMGASGLRDLARQLFEQDPNLERVMGRRVTGARSGTESADRLVSVTREQVLGEILRRFGLLPPLAAGGLLAAPGQGEAAP